VAPVGHFQRATDWPDNHVNPMYGWSLHYAHRGMQFNSQGFGRRCRMESTGSAGYTYDSVLAEAFVATRETELPQRQVFLS
jgi:hypothetical protein